MLQRLHLVLCVFVPMLAVTLGCVEAPAPEAPPPTAPPPAPVGFDLTTARTVDLSWAYGDDTLYWPSSPSDFELHELAHGVNAQGFFYAANTLCTPEHGGTHLDAPIHFAEGAWTAEQIPVDRFIAPAIMIDVSVQAAVDADYRLTLADVEAWETVHGPIPPGSVVLLRTGWDARWPDRLAYFGDDTPGDASNLHFPSYGAEATERLIERGVLGLGVDTPSIDHGPSTDFPVHRLSAAENIYGLENLRALDQVPPTGAWVLALPMKITGGSGGPARVVALVSEA
ncbi:MAG: cyclase family protein [Acidobacteriota bacterium]